MVVKYDFSVDAWLSEVEVEGGSEAECEENLMNMSLGELIDAGYVKDFSIKNLDSKITEKTVAVKVYNVDYNIDEEDAEENNTTIEEILKSLPQELVYDIEVYEDDDLDDLIEDEISNDTGWTVNNFDYAILEEY